MSAWGISRYGFFFGIRGLSNYNLSCCVNSLLQSLFATSELVELLQRWDPAGSGEDRRNVPLQLKRTFADMKSDRPQTAPHRNFLHSLDQNRVRLNVQHDADEVFLSILHFIQQQMDDKALALEIQNLYKIAVETCLQCLKCSSVQTRSSYTLTLPLHVKEDEDSLEGCISSFLTEQLLTDVDSCFCEQCGAKTPSKWRLKLLSLPPILCVHLKRFRSISGETRKLDCKVTFPERFDFSEVAQDAFPPDAAKAGVYTLYAVVVHSGFAMFGHYTAFIHHRETQRWYYANDSHVEEASWEEVQQTYGGYRRHTAYMLMYRRDSKQEGQQSELSG
ncbi:ubl carboxyl-terminal hydrolase 18 isoform X2 [Echeneis naucrates]|uniref:ubl carboxyl-terminal hydrolase 18 isoform X2 n=1 Tax=Echeneis naucrates TaxID=173247 RepID=UPI001113F174|nr:ubl carboxyl-terminal hydrolase 18 isoform X2 [Echeneis naucrates]